MNSARPMRRPNGAATTLVVGVYPSAFHVAWSPPVDLDPRGGDRRRPFIGSLAVDVEPVVFWDGVTPLPSAELDRWMGAVQFDSTKHGTVSVGTNGPSGVGVIEQFLTPLRIDASSAAFTDVMPWFFVKHGSRSQGVAVAQRFAPIAEILRLHPGSLPSRPTERVLVQLAGSDVRRDTLRRELLDAGAPLVITLGQEAVNALRAVADVTGVQAKLAPTGYGQVGEIAVDSHRMALMPLAHPGFVRQTRDAAWVEALAKWCDAQAAI
jgi:hypothetical protein